MFIWLVEFADSFPVLNLFRYITFRTGGALFTGALIVFLFGPKIINSLRVRQGRGQPIRADGPQTHFKKAGTPTMGGLMILAGIVISSLLWADLGNTYVITTLLVTLGFGAIGFYDDYLKVTKAIGQRLFRQSSYLLLEFLIAGVAAYFILSQSMSATQDQSETFATSLSFPFFKDFLLDLGLFFIPFGAFVIVSAGNAVNLTDGLDGLAIVPVMIAAASFGAIAYLAGNALFANYLQIHFVPGTGELAVILGALIGAGLRFLMVQRATCCDLYGRYRFVSAWWFDRYCCCCDKTRDRYGNHRWLVCA
ncbi:phospho-N-acetylmuramoyl-pentapeptide-transferase [Psychrosphaera aquimarina]|uniref:Phospho-N-acetylmuramoyl-pentapeptide-transferase n=1 Tax=Psychrosphaera aquimarina TaxID=2044854 RepID=A0ABU3QYV1_9GAMM|nr:phospho-N-acetylmuramoyl-pentapeptide-transferase [Psychrosphaera aquimarina]MDU0112607.1 phospho-N-acetylmuramoyl-pentapeptide-transferase [Psychrosphaera aquimarina]